MADHVITLNTKQEAAATTIVNNINNRTDPPGTLTIDTWLKQVSLPPIKAQIAADDAARLAAIETALPSATNDQINQIKTILGIV